MITAQDRLLATLKQLESEYPGTTGCVILYTDGSGALKLERLLSIPQQRIAIDFDSDDDIESVLEHLREKAVTTL